MTPESRSNPSIEGLSAHLSAALSAQVEILGDDGKRAPEFEGCGDLYIPLRTDEDPIDLIRDIEPAVRGYYGELGYEEQGGQLSWSLMFSRGGHTLLAHYTPADSGLGCYLSVARRDMM